MKTKVGTRTMPVRSQVAADAYAPSWGAKSVHRLPLGVQRKLLSLLGLAQRAWLLVPVLVVSLALVFFGTQYYFKAGYSGHGGIIGFAQIGDYAAHAVGRPELATTHSSGYDGQYYYFMASHPALIVTCAHDLSTCPAHNPEYWSQRILYPMTAWLLALGQADLIPYTLVLVNGLAILVTVIVVGQLAVEAGASRWLGAAAGLFCGETVSFLGDLSDAYSVMWVVVAIYFLRRQRYLWSAAAVAATLLTRESLIFYVPFLALPVLAQRRWLTLIQSAVVALGPFVVWQVVLKVLYGPWALLSGDSASAGLVKLPFLGLYQARKTADFKLVLIFVAVPVLLTGCIALLALWQHGPADLVWDPVPVMAFTYCLLFSLTGILQWNYFGGSTRLAVPGVVLGVLVASRLPSVRASYGTLIAFTSLSTLFVVWGR